LLAALAAISLFTISAVAATHIQLGVVGVAYGQSIRFHAVSLEPAGTSKGMWNQAQLFHESLHGYTGFDDIFFLDHFYNNEKLASIYISYWFADNISFLQGAAVTCGN
jgi:hypothetical protein